MSQKTSCIRHPANNPFIIRREWAVRAIRRSREKMSRREEAVECAAEILNLLEYHTNNPMANEILNNLSKRALIRKGVLRSLGGWLPYSVAYIEECLFEGRGKDVISKSLLILLEMRFISQNVPEDLKEFYASGVVKWFRLNVDNINKWIDTFYGGDIDIDDLDSEQQEITVTVPGSVVAPNPLKEDYGGKRQAIIQICSFHRHIHNKPLTYVYGKKRKTVIYERLKEGRRMGHFAQAIIGCVLSPHHQGKNPETNPDNKIHDDIELICRSEIYFERFINYAEERGVTEGVAFNEFKKVIGNGYSKYSKAFLKQEEKKKEEEEIRVRRGIELLPAEELHRYNLFAKEMATYFVIPTSLPDIFNTIRESEKLTDLSRGLVNDDVLYECLVDNVKVFNPRLDGDGLATIQSFSRKLTEMLRMKK